MLSQRTEEFRQEMMLQNYNESFPELRYPQLHMPPPVEYNTLVQHVDQPWYNNFAHGGAQNGGSEFFARANDNKTPTEWNNYHSDTESPFVPSQMNNNSCDGQYTGNALPQLMGQQLPQMDSPLLSNPMMGSTPNPLMIDDVNGLITNGVDTTHLEPNPTPKEEENLPKIDGPRILLASPPAANAKEVNKDAKRLPGFHQTFGNITEIGRFSQHDDYFEAGPAADIVETPKMGEPIEPPPKRKPRGRKRKQPESYQRPPYSSPEPPPPPSYPSEPYWQYHHHHHDQYHPPSPAWRSHPYYHQQQQQYHHHHHCPPPPHQMPPSNHHNPYYQHYNDYAPPPHPYYNSHYPSNWHMNRDYMVHSYPGYV